MTSKSNDMGFTKSVINIVFKDIADSFILDFFGIRS